LLGCSLLRARLAAALAFMVSERFLFLARLSASPVIMGEIRKDSGLLPKAYVPDPKLEAASENLRRAIGKAGGA
jgi:hypothetical protein